MPEKNAWAERMRGIFSLLSEDSSDVQDEIVEFCMHNANKIPIHFPKWLLAENTKRYCDSDEITSALPQIIREWYNGNRFPVCIVVPDAVLLRKATLALERSCTLEKVELVYVKADGTGAHKKEFGHAILLCPSMCQSLQLSVITSKIHHSSSMLLLDLYRTESIHDSIQENDRRQLEFLVARWEVEKNTDTRQDRFSELLMQLRAMIGGAGN